MGEFKNSDSKLNPDFRFENFRVDDNNNVAYSAALYVAESRGNEFNPLLIYGASGLGKTHLMTAIGNYILENGDKKVIFFTAERFIYEIKENVGMEKYLDWDVLLVDDVHLIIRNEEAQKEFFKVFDWGMNAGKNIVMTCDRHPTLMIELDDVFRRNFISGLPVEIKSLARK